jgi:hypothetical protein
MNRRFTFQPVGGSPLTKFGVNQLENPFCTDAYIAAMEMLGYQPWVIGTQVDGRIQDAAIALLRRGRISVTLEFVSLPSSAAHQDFWNSIYTECRLLKVTNLIAGTFASPPFKLPCLAGEYLRTDRTEHVISVDHGNFEKAFSSDLRRNIRKARSAGLTIRHGSGHTDWLQEHVRVQAESMGRRAERGESVPMNLPRLVEYEAYLRSGAGVLFQAVQGERVVSSDFVLRSAQSAYGHSMGTSPEGMNLGASHFLIFSICKELEREGVRIFNLGGAPKGSSLGRFKAAFGASEISLTACSCYLGPSWLKRIHSAISAARTDSRQLWKLLVGQSKPFARRP